MSLPRACLAAAVFGLAALGTSASAQTAQTSQIERGRYLVRAGDCESCHTVKQGQAFAGGMPIPTPFGVIYSPNITPDPDTGIGKWSKDDFWNAMHHGIDDEGKHLYPAFPYPWFTKLSRADVDAIKDYLATVPAVKHQNMAPDLPWPLSWRAVMAGWNLFYFRAGEYEPNAAQVRGMEPRRVPGRRRRPLRRLPHAEERPGRDQDGRRAAGRKCRRALVRAQPDWRRARRPRRLVRG